LSGAGGDLPKLSGTVASAQQAKEQFPGAPIEIVDLQSAAMALGFQALMAARRSRGRQSGRVQGSRP
jgi:fatty acid-binding protein DegV